MLLALVSGSIPAVASARSAPSATGTLPTGSITEHGWSLVPKDAAGLDAGGVLRRAGVERRRAPARRREPRADDSTRATIWRSRDGLQWTRERAPVDDRHGDRGRGRRRHRARDRRHRPQWRVGLRLAFRRRWGELDRGGGWQRCVRHARARDGPAQRQRIASTRWMVGCVRWSFRRLRRDLGLARRSPLAAGARSERGGSGEHRAGSGRVIARVRGARSRGSPRDVTRWGAPQTVSVPDRSSVSSVARGATTAVVENLDRHGQPTPLLRSTDGGRTWNEDAHFLATFADAARSRRSTVPVVSGSGPARPVPRTHRALRVTWTPGSRRISRPGRRFPAELYGGAGGTLSLVAAVDGRVVVVGTAGELDRYYTIDREALRRS